MSTNEKPAEQTTISFASLEDPSVTLRRIQASLSGAMQLLWKIEGVLDEQVDDPCCGWGPLHAEVKAFLECADCE